MGIKTGVGGIGRYRASDLDSRKVMRIIDEELLNEVSSEAKVSPRLRMRSACRFACQRIITFISRWRINVIGC